MEVDGIVGPVELGVVASPDIALLVLLLFDIEPDGAPLLELPIEPAPIEPLPMDELPAVEPWDLEPVPSAEPLLLAEPPFRPPPPPPPLAPLPPACAMAAPEPSARHAARIEVEKILFIDEIQSC